MNSDGDCISDTNFYNTYIDTYTALVCDVLDGIITYVEEEVTEIEARLASGEIDIEDLLNQEA